MKRLVSLLVFLLVLGLAGSGWAAVWYVKTDGSDTNSGTSWDDAFQTIQKAIEEAIAWDEIWVEEGTYSLFSGIWVDKAVAIYGGFGGWETQREQREWVNNVTTVDGQNSVRCFYVTADATIDGFTITKGNTYGSGAGIHNFDCSPTIAKCTLLGNSAATGGGITNNKASSTITNCTFSGNYAIMGGGIDNIDCSPTITNCAFSGNSGGGIYNSNSFATITNCTFSENRASYGGGIDNFDSSPAITNCRFLENNAYSGGGIYIGDYSSPTITNCTFSGNTADGGGGITNSDSSPTIANCIFSGNSADDWGGGVVNWSSSPTITNCTFSGNSADNGGAIYNHDSFPTITNCILWGDTAPDGPEIYDRGTSSPFVTYSDVQGGYPGEENIDADPVFKDAKFHLGAGSPCIDAGTNDAPDLPAKDFEGDSRIIDGDDDGTATVDMGADEYVPPSWRVAYGVLFGDLSDLALLRHYRDEFLTKTKKGKLYTGFLYKNSEDALKVLLNNPQLMLQAKELIDANKDAVSEVLNGNTGFIYNTDEILSFLRAFAKKAPLSLKVLAYLVRREMLKKRMVRRGVWKNRNKGNLFFGFRLE